MLPWSYEFYRNKLSPNAKKFYGNLLVGINSKKRNIIIPGAGVEIEKMSGVFEAVMRDHPEFFWVDGYSGYKCYKTAAYSGIDIKFFFTDYEIKRLQKEADEWRYNVCRQIPSNVGEMVKIWMLYDYLARQISYGDSELKYSQTIIGGIKKEFHRSVCEGIAKSFKYLCDYANINCIVIGGYLNTEDGGGPHAWNIIECDHKLYHIDVTAELENAKYQSKANSKTFLRKSSDMVEYSWDRRIIC